MNWLIHWLLVIMLSVGLGFGLVCGIYEVLHWIGVFYVSF